MKEVREKLESLKKFIVSKYKFIQAIGIIPPQASEMFDEENELSEEEKKHKPMHLIVVCSTGASGFNKINVENIKMTNIIVIVIHLSFFIKIIVILCF